MVQTKPKKCSTTQESEAIPLVVHIHMSNQKSLSDDNSYFNLKSMVYLFQFAETPV